MKNDPARAEILRREIVDNMRNYVVVRVISTMPGIPPNALLIHPEDYGVLCESPDTDFVEALRRFDFYGMNVFCTTNVEAGQYRGARIP